MSSRRVLKAAQAIREVVSMAIITDLKDPRIKNVTVTMVEVTPDMRQAKVNVSVMGDETKQNLCLHGLQNSAGYLQQKVGKRIDTRYTPRIEFVLDKGQINALTVTRILEEVLPRERAEQEGRSLPSEANGSSVPQSSVPQNSANFEATADENSNDQIESVDTGNLDTDEVT